MKDLIWFWDVSYFKRMSYSIERECVSLPLNWLLSGRQLPPWYEVLQAPARFYLIKKTCSLMWNSRLSIGVSVVQKNFFWKSDAANDFSRCITPKNDVDQFSQKKFWCLGGAQLNFSLWRHLKKWKNHFSENTSEWYINRRRMTPWVVICWLFWFVSIR